MLSFQFIKLERSNTIPSPNISEFISSWSQDNTAISKTMSHYVTTHNPNGNALFSSKVALEPVVIPTVIGSMKILWTTHNTPVNVSTELDIDQYVHDRTNGLGNHICPGHGTALATLSIEPNKASLFHCTMSLDTCVVIEGVLELHLDSGETRTFRAGDSVVQRAVMHKWVNVTPNDGWAKMVAFAQAIVEPVDVGGKRLETEFRV